ncbi:histone H1 [Olivibacter sp. SDN3]|uniref:Histone H1 n=1 Tax=Olivibacter jilunii TaxID=985016 RepID=A0ABW6B9X8_9SPHI|nr:histone H1 [Olivibacter sp. SDN3]QNL50259.1 histone H1 [Olivibacter sp. SDN3]
MEKFAALKELIASAEKDAQAFYEKGNKAAGTRLRGALQNTKTLAQEIRNEVTAKKNAK